MDGHTPVSLISILSNKIFYSIFLMNQRLLEMTGCSLNKNGFELRVVNDCSLDVSYNDSTSVFLYLRTW